VDRNGDGVAALGVHEIVVAAARAAVLPALGSSVRLTAATPEARTRVDNLDRLFKLTDVWTAALPMAERELYEKLESPLTPGSVMAALDETVGSGRGPVGQLKDGTFVRSRYADYLRTTDVQALIEEWTERLEEAEQSRRLHAADAGST
jgi:hypothetical protein